MAETSQTDPFIRRALVVAALIAAGFLLWRSLDVVLLAVAALVLAALLRAVADPLAQVSRLPAIVALIITIVAGLALLVGAGWLFGVEIRDQVQELSGRLPAAWDRLKAWALGLPLADRLMSGADAIPLGHGEGLASRVSGLVASFADAATNLMLVLAAGVYLAANPGAYRKGLLALSPPDARPRVGRLMDDGATALKRWLLAQAISMAVVGVLSGLGLWLAGVPSPLALGLLAGLLEFVPIVGPILAAIPAILMGLTVDPETAGWAFLVFLVVQQLESNAITPLVQRKVVAIPPVVTLFAVVVAGLVFGALGVALAGPLTVLVVVAVQVLYLDRRAAC